MLSSADERKNVNDLKAPGGKKREDSKNLVYFLVSENNHREE